MIREVLADSATSINTAVITTIGTVIVALIGTLGASFKRRPAEPVLEQLPAPDPPHSTEQWVTMIDSRDREIMRLTMLLRYHDIDPETGRRFSKQDP